MNSSAPATIRDPHTVLENRFETLRAVWVPQEGCYYIHRYSNISGLHGVSDQGFPSREAAAAGVEAGEVTFSTGAQQ